MCDFDEQTVALAKDAAPSALRVAALDVMASINSGDVASVESLLDDGEIRLSSACSVCDEDVISTSKYTSSTFRAFIRGAEERFDVKSPAVRAVDTTGAGDVFAGVLAADWQSGFEDALRRACAAGALATLVRGAGDCAPTGADIDAILCR